MQYSKALPAGISLGPFGELPDGSPVAIYSLRNTKGVEARVCNYGGILVSFQAPDRSGNVRVNRVGYRSFARLL